LTAVAGTSSFDCCSICSIPLPNLPLVLFLYVFNLISLSQECVIEQKKKYVLKLILIEKLKIVIEKINQ
ncbi:hypothetical protein, partial [Paenibacillus koleovorans]|uniref:hypothetical protein n=1 Tax=Paenibacillus koleovorans TaxID=121608 RepID=UPI001C3FA501